MEGRDRGRRTQDWTMCCVRMRNKGGKHRRSGLPGTTRVQEKRTTHDRYLFNLVFFDILLDKSNLVWQGVCPTWPGPSSQFAKNKGSRTMPLAGDSSTPRRGMPRGALELPPRHTKQNSVSPLTLVQHLPWSDLGSKPAFLFHFSEQYQE